MADTFPRIGSALIVRDEANRILLGKRNKDPQRGSWILPGGKIHAFESIALAAARELEEETGLKVEVESQFRVYEIINPPEEHRIVIYSWGRVMGGEPKASDDLSELRFVPLRELGGMLTTPLVRRVLEDAGFLSEAPEAVTSEHAERQMNLLVIPIAVAEERASVRSRRVGQRRHRTRAPSAFNLPLEFDGNSVLASHKRNR